MDQEPGTPAPEGDPTQRLLEQRIVVLGRDIDEALAERVAGQLRQLDARDPDRDIALYLNSPGGSVTGAMLVFHTMEYETTADVRTYGLGLVGGLTSLLLAAGAPGKRFLLPKVQVHLGPVAPGVMAPGRDYAGWANPEIAGLYARFTGRPVGRVTADLAAGTWFDAPGAVAYGLADGVVGRGG